LPANVTQAVRVYPSDDATSVATASLATDGDWTTGWRGAGATAQVLVVQLGDGGRFYELAAVRLRRQSSRVRDGLIEVARSDGGADQDAGSELAASSGWATVARFSLSREPDTLVPLSGSADVERVRFVRITILTTHGNYWAGLREVTVVGRVACIDD